MSKKNKAEGATQRTKSFLVRLHDFTQNNKVRYAYFGREKTNRPHSRGGGPEHDGIVTTAYQFVAKNLIDVAFAYCMPSDGFNKGKARLLSTRRLMQGERRCKRTGLHLHCVQCVSIKRGEKPLEAVCRAFDNVANWARPHHFHDLVIKPETTEG